MSDPFAENFAVQFRNQRLNTLLKEYRLIKNHIKTFLDNRYKIEIKNTRNRFCGNARIHLPGKNAQSCLNMGVNIVIISSNRLGRNFQFLEMKIGKKAGAGTFLPVQKTDTRMRQILKPLDIERIAANC